MRGFFWDLWLIDSASRGILSLAPDLQFDTPFQGAQMLVNLVDQQFSAHKKQIVLIGHSLGGILVALAARSIPREQLRALVIIGSPFGSPGRSSLDILIRSLIRIHLIPGFLIRNTFFGPKVSKESQQLLFDKAVPESQQLLNIVSDSSWLKDELFPEPIPLPVLGITSPWDKIVPPASSRHLIDALGGTFVELGEEIKMGHNDLAVLPDTVTHLSTLIDEWLGSQVPTFPSE